MSSSGVDHQPTIRVTALWIDAVEPHRLARFWADALGWTHRRPDHDGVAAAVPTDGTEIELRFRPVDAPKTARNAVHLDLTSESSEDQTRSADRLVSMGAERIDVGQGPDAPHVVLADPERNELCILAPGNTWVADRGRLGTIVCDGSPTVGRFWSAALGWPLIWDQDGETAVRQPNGPRTIITWGPPVPNGARADRLRLELSWTDDQPVADLADRLRRLGATVVDLDERTATLADPDGWIFHLTSN